MKKWLCKIAKNTYLTHEKKQRHLTGRIKKLVVRELLKQHPTQFRHFFCA